MDALNASRRRTYDSPKAESGLAEWTTKIKALQRQVDEDEEAETKKLEEEIRASRMSRMRRSTLQSRPSSFDLSRSQESVRTASPPDDIKESQDDRQRNQGATMRRLMGQRSPNTTTEFPREISPLASPPQPSSKPILIPKPDSMSLAAFMGSKATGPRLNKHAPQQDVHDTTQFGRPGKISSPHPLFGKNGVAMPGMSSAVKFTVSESRAPTSVKVEVPLSPVPTRERQISSASIAKKYVEKLEQNTSTAQKTAAGLGNNIRTRTMSTPSGPDIFRSSMSPRLPADSKPDLSHSLNHRPSFPDVRLYERTQPSTTPPSAASPKQSIYPASLQSMPRKPSVVIQSPVHPAQSTPKAIQEPQFALSKSSPSSLKPTPQKDVTPSISRLQGRGFVQKMVKVSSQFEAAATSPSGSHPQTPEKGTGSDAKRSFPVLDRWHSNSAAAHPIIPPKPAAMRKTKSVDPSNLSAARFSPTVSPLKPAPSPIIKDKAQNLTSSTVFNNPSKPAPPSPSCSSVEPPTSKNRHTENIDEEITYTPGLGSSNTLMSYVRPMSTGGSPPEASRSKTQVEPGKTRKSPPFLGTQKASVGVPSANEIRFRKDSFGKLKGSGRNSAFPSATPSDVSSLGEPLSHLTKDRARKPKRTKPMTTIVQSQTPHPADSRPTPTPTISSSSRNVERPVPFPASSAPVLHSHPEAQRDEEQHRSILPVSPATTATLQNSSIEPTTPKVADKWRNQPLIGVKPMLNGRGEPPTGQVKSQHNGMVGRKPLPGLVTSSPPSTETTSTTKEEKSPGPSTPLRPARIPSTGNRATVMDVAQLWSEHKKDSSSETISHLVFTDPDNEEAQKADVKAAIANWEDGARSLVPPSPTLTSAEKRKSSLEKYSALAMPIVKEEKGIVPTPGGSLRIRDTSSLNNVDFRVDEEARKADVKYSPIHVLHTSLNPSRKVVNVKGDDLVNFENHPEPLPKVDVSELLKSNQNKCISRSNAQTISVDVLSIVGSASTAVKKDVNVFYDSETLAIIHRSKIKPSGLAETKVWGWVGRNSKNGQKEENILAELAKRYGTQLMPVKQHREPAELVEVLGGQLAIRQGSRAHWSSENTAMHLVRLFNGSIFIDEQDLSVQNLCSGFSYCITILETVYVWHGCGSMLVERNAALAYARGLNGKPDGIIELNEGENDEDDMFWMILGERDYAQAQYWKWRLKTEEVDPKVWKVKIGAKEQLCLLPSLPEETELDQDVFVLDCIWELFVLVGSGARGKRQDIRLALAAAMGLSTHGAASKPFVPTVHVLILPSQIPMDLRLSLRGLDVEQINHGHIPEHMNILPVAQALEHLDRSCWDQDALRDKTMLPLGLHEDDLP